MPRPVPDTDPALTPAQQAALAHVRTRGAAAREAARARLSAALAAEREPGTALRNALARARVGLNFHPDRLAADGRLVIEGLRDDGLYRNQFESRISNGALSAHPGGARDDWEAGLFGAAYHDPPATASERPKYGALDLLGFPDGPAPRFGSCHLRLRPAVLARSTLCFGDSHLGPTDLGTLDEPDAVLAGLVEALRTTGSALGHAGSAASFLRALGGNDTEPARAAEPTGSAEPGRALDEYIEVQVHGPVRLATDVETVVADPAFRNTPIGGLLTETCARYGVTLAWHRGFVLGAGEVPPEFRGPRVAELARRLSVEANAPVLDASHLGHAARSVVTEPGRWSDWGTPEETLQHLKQLWHVLVRYGRAHSTSSRSLTNANPSTT